MAPYDFDFFFQFLNLGGNPSSGARTIGGGTYSRRVDHASSRTLGPRVPFSGLSAGTSHCLPLSQSENEMEGESAI
jgi:hypothetical protein